MYISFFGGIVVGLLLGVLVMGLLQASRREDSCECNDCPLLGIDGPSAMCGED